MNIPKMAYCRLCADLKPYKKLSNLDTDEEKGREIINKLDRVNAKTDFNDNVLPKAVCFVCINSLERAYEFITSIERAQVTLNDIMLSKEVKKEYLTYDTEDLVFEVSEIKCEDDSVTEIKIEAEEPDVQLVPTRKNSKNEGKKTQRLSLSVDTIPLAQLKLTWQDFNWLCSVCGIQFPTVDELTEHSMQYHRRCNAYRCTDCNFRKLSFKKFLIHVRRHRKHLKLSCYKCYKEFSTPHKTLEHIKTHTTTEFVCPGCDANFFSNNELVKHTEEFYRSRKDGEQVYSSGLTCLICKKDFEKRANLNAHLLTHTVRSRDFICEICGKGFYKIQSLEDHSMRQHSNVRPHKCEICNLTFKAVQQLRNHVGVHDGGKPFACEQCGKCFRLQRQLMSHNIIHTDSLPHVCPYCNKGFRFKTILNQHIRQHTGVKPYSCTVCQRDFTNWPNYNKHMKRKHGMDMAKKKHTPNGVYPIDPKTGEVVYPEMDNMEEWKQKMMQPRRQRKKSVANGDKVTVVESKETDDN